MKKYSPYIIGFVSSIILTLLSYLLVSAHVSAHHQAIPHEVLIPGIVILAVIQLVVQLIFFLHLLSGKRSEMGWRLMIFFSTISIIIVVIIGSLWIMNNLNYNMTPHEVNQYIIEQDGF